MTWNTPTGIRIIAGDEKDLITAALNEMAMEVLESDLDEKLEIGVDAFDNMTACEQLIMLDIARQYLSEETSELNPVSGDLEGAVAAIFAFVRSCVEAELEAIKKLRHKAQRKLFRKWRMLVYKSCKSCDWSVSPRANLAQWTAALNFLQDQILHESDSQKDETEQRSATKELPQLSAEEMLKVIKRLLDQS